MMAANNFYIGIDGGGTKTALCAAGDNPPLLHYHKTSGTSWREHGVFEVAHTLGDAVHTLLGDKFDQIAGMAMGLPCYGESVEGDRLLEQTIHNVFPGVPLYFTNDVEVGWAGSMALAPGINIVAGTGSIAFGKDNKGKTARSGGWSEFFGDEGSCYWIGRKVMELFSKQSDGRLPKDELYTIVSRELALKNDISFIDRIHSEYCNSRERVASMQLLAGKAALAGSHCAKALYDEAVGELLQLVSAIRRQLDFTDKPWKVSYSGGLFKAGDLVLPKFIREIEKDGGKLCTPLFNPVEGALLLAFQHFNPKGMIQIIKTLETSNSLKIES